MALGETTKINCWIARFRAGDSSAADDLFRHFQSRLVHLTRTMLQDFPAVHRWEETGDVFQGAARRLHSALKKIEPRDTPHFFRLAATQIRRELRTLAKRYRSLQGPSDLWTREEPGFSSADAHGQIAYNSDGPDRLANWTEFHEKAAALPAPLREVFDLIYYEGMSRVDAALVLGVNERTVRNRLQQAKLALHSALDGGLPWE